MLKGAAAQTPEMKRVMKRHGAFGATACGMMKMVYNARLTMKRFRLPFLDERANERGQCKSRKANAYIESTYISERVDQMTGPAT